MLDKIDFRELKNAGTFIFWVTGGPSSGKTTLCTKLAEYFSFLHISISELLDNLVKTNSSKGNDDFTTLRKSQVIPSSIVVFLIKQKMATHNDFKGKTFYFTLKRNSYF